MASCEQNEVITGHESSVEMSYDDYLLLENILNAQRPLSASSNEMLFIIQHQISELWMKLTLHELGGARKAVREDAMQVALKGLARVQRIFEQLVKAWDVLATLNPSEFSAIRRHLGRASGLQSQQYRRLEFVLGNKDERFLHRNVHHPAVGLLRAELETPSLYDEVIRLLARRQFAISPARVERDWRHSAMPDPSVEAAWLAVYRSPNRHWDLHQIAERLIDLEDAFRQWRFRHLITVERIIGAKSGTGGTDGLPYLRKKIDVILFPELWSSRTSI